jgi:purine catabolism regulator
MELKYKFFEQISYNNSFFSIAQLLSNNINNPVLIENNHFKVIARSSPNKGTHIKKNTNNEYIKPQLSDPHIISFVQQVNLQRKPIKMPPLEKYGIKDPRIVFPIMNNYNILGYLHVFETNKTVTEQDIEIINNSILALITAFLCQETATKIKTKFNRKLLGSLIDENLKNLNYFLEKKILMIDYDFEQPTWLFAMKGFNTRKSNNVNNDTINEFELFIHDIIEDLNCAVITVNQFTLLFLQCPYKTKNIDLKIREIKIIEVAHALKNALEKFFPNVRFHIGIGRLCLKLQDYSLSLEEACKSLDFTSVNNPVILFDSLGSIGILGVVHGNERLINFAEQFLNKIVAYDKQHDNILLHTLKAFFNNECHLEKTAEALYIHINTLRYRLNKIMELGNFNINSFKTRFDLYLALKIYELTKNI